ncbi:anti-sigma factor [Streptomyces triticiradicis]|uniref:Anti-sigma factor n=1 Tax=Streptomyces triticiradicis TaxID=2651189 RepID=A0A7J5D569_9ACTN|nr:anti-sigma factor [Streptomyces triticiradicis]KAB1977759.1 anti-sigma factor [Streptomyces triticiradicis]
MEHIDEETLALMALGEGSSAADRNHLRQCARCNQELAALFRTVSTLKSPPIPDHELVGPPADLWSSIARELRLDPSGSAGVAETRQRAETDDPRRHDRSSEPADAHRSGTPSKAGPRRAARFSLALAACAALLGAAAGSGITWWATHTSTSASSAQGRQLDSLQDNSAGYARLVDSRGQRTLDITVHGLPQTAGYFEVWLMDRTHTKLVSMGVLGADGRASLPVPDNIDLNEYSVVDVSVQPYNGRPNHSGDSLVRGPYAS